MTDTTTPEALKIELGRKLKGLRNSAGLTITEAGALIEKSDSTISRLENGLRPVSTLELGALLEGYRVPREERPRYIAMAREASKRSPYEDYPIPRGLESLLALEPVARQLRSYSSQLVYGLLQTPDYSRHVITAGLADGSRHLADGLVGLRRRRTDRVLDGVAPPEVHAIVDEAAIRRVVGGREVMRDQVRHLVDMSQRPDVTVQVLPFSAGAHPAQSGSFLHIVVRGDTGPGLIYCDGVLGNAYQDNGDKVRHRSGVFDQLAEQYALDPDDSRRFLETAAKEYTRA